MKKQPTAKNSAEILSKRYLRSAHTSICKHFRLSGLLGALVFFCLAMTPSLLPRPTLFMGIIAGIATAIGYGFGLIFSLFIRVLFGSSLKHEHRRHLWIFFYIASPFAVILMSILGSSWQNQVRLLVGETKLKGSDILQIAIITVVTFLVTLGISRLVRYVYGLSRRRLTFKLPRWIGVSASLVLIVLVGGLILKDVAYDNLVGLARDVYSKQNEQIPLNVNQPNSSNRSGSPDSLVSWPSIGAQGQRFVSGGPTTDELSQWSGKKPMEQIRVYVGVNTANTAQSRADIALKELIRTKAFDRKYLIVATPTGTGLIEPQSADAMAYLTNGNSAIVATQYSYLPSWISFIVDKDNARESGKTLYDTVYDYWSGLDKKSRPQLIAYGLSLGSFGGQAAFSGLSDMQVRTEGALFMGTPNDTEPWRTFTTKRDPASPEILPIYDGGQQVRFAYNQETIMGNQNQWKNQRILYMQHASDPVIWWSPDLIVSKPDWLKEKRGTDVVPNMRWIPAVTFLQVTVDQFFGTTVPNGHGHNYANTIVYALNSIIKNTNWSDEQIVSLQEKMTSYSID